MICLLLLHFGIFFGVYNSPVVYSLPLEEFYPFGAKNGNNNITCSDCCFGNQDVKLSVNISFDGAMHDHVRVSS